MGVPEMIVCVCDREREREGGMCFGFWVGEESGTHIRRSW